MLAIKGVGLTAISILQSKQRSATESSAFLNMHEESNDISEEEPSQEINDKNTAKKRKLDIIFPIESNDEPVLLELDEMEIPHEEITPKTSKKTLFNLPNLT